MKVTDEFRCAEDVIEPGFFVTPAYPWSDKIKKIQPSLGEFYVLGVSYANPIILDGTDPKKIEVITHGICYIRTSEDIPNTYVNVGEDGYAVGGAGTTYRVLEIIRQRSDDPHGVGYGVVKIFFK